MKKTILASSLLLLSVSLYAKPFVQCANNQCGLMDSEGFWTVEPKYEHISYNPEGLSKFIEKDQFGYLDESGKVVIRPQESNIYRFAQNGLAKFKKNNKWGVTDKKFETIVPAKYEFLTDYAPNGLAAAKLEGKYGFIDSKGAVVIPFKYTFAASFAPNGLAVVEQNGLYGYIDARDNMVIKPQFKRANTFSQNGLALVYKDGEFGFINAKGEVAIEFKKQKMEPFAQNSLALIQKEGKYGFMDSKGKIVIPAVYNAAQSFMPNGLAIIHKEGKYGVIDSSGAFKIKPEFTNVRDSLDNYSLALKHESRGWEVYEITSGKIIATYKVDEKDVPYEISNAKGEVIWPKPKKDVAKPLKQEPVAIESKPKVIAPVKPTIKENIQKETTISKKQSNQSIFSDSVTGLVWQDDSEAKTNRKDWNKAKSYCENLTLGGYSDWRLPNIFELTTLIDNTKSKEPYVVDGIKNIKSYNYWSSTTGAGNTDGAWIVDFYFGVHGFHNKANYDFVRCVRAGQLNFDDLVILKNKGKLKVSQENVDEIASEKSIVENKPKEEKIVSKKELNQSIFSDSSTGLVWQDNSEAKTNMINWNETKINQKNWDEAKSYCEKLTLDGYSDWRLPNVFELSTLIDNTNPDEPFVIGGLENYYDYWTSTTLVENTNYAANVAFRYGDINAGKKRDNKYVRCVRGKTLNFDDLSLLKKSGKIKVSQENIDRIKP